MKTILVPIDFSPTSQRVLDEAARLATAFKGRLVLMHVVSLPVVLSEYPTESASYAAMAQAAEQVASRNLASYERSLTSQGVPVRVVRQTGHPSTSIVTQAKKLRADYIVIGSHGHTAFYDLIVGSTASGIIKRSPCTVVVVPPAKAKKAKAASKRRRS